MRVRTLLVMLLTIVLVAAGCGGDDGGEAGGGEELTFWSLEDVAERIQATQQIVDRYTRQTGQKVKLVPVAEDQFNQLITSASAAGNAPDVIGGLGLGNVHRLVTDDLADQDAANEVVDDLGRETFAPRALELFTAEGKLVGVPSDAWTQILVYRKDLTDKAGLQPPETYEAMQAAAARLGTGGVAGITAATKPDDAFTQQTFEHIALANGCQLADASGKVTLDTPQCVNAIRFYTDLIKQHSVKGGQDVDTTRATYFAGKAAMLVWSTFILDEMAGLRKDTLPTCPECRQDREYLSKNAGIVTAIKGPDAAEPSQYGEVTGWSISRDGDVDGAKRFVRFMMDEAYLDWLALAPEGKYPVRKGTEQEAEKFATGWEGLKAGVDIKKPLSEAYSPEVLDVVRSSVDRLSRWGFQQGQAGLAGALLGELPVPKALADVIDGQLDADQAAKRMQDEVTQLSESLG
jgi:multiple sugar transport system substrate-binding protein